MAVRAEESGVIEVSTADKLESALSSAGDGERVIKLTDDIEAPGLGVSSTVTILGGGHTLTMSQNASIHVYSGAQLNLGAADGSDALTIRGDGQTSNDTPGLLYVQGSCDMYSRVTLADHEGNNYFGGGVTVEGGTFHMHGGTIENCGIKGGSVCYGGGVAVVYGGSFVMDGGLIKGCYVETGYVDYYDPTRCIAGVGGGVFVSGASSFTMNGGSIIGNSATNMGGGVAVITSYEEVSQGFGALKSCAELLGGKIENNKAHDGSGVLASAYYYAYANALCADAPSEGAIDKQGLYFDGITVNGNTADMDSGCGGGVYAVWTKVEANAATITGNSASRGAGVMACRYADVDISGGAITGNKASLLGGGLAADTDGIDATGGSVVNHAVTVTDTVLCNNTAGTAGADVYSTKSVVKLSSARDMNTLYQGEPADVANKMIDGWYLDVANSRYAAQPADQRREYANYANIGMRNTACLVAASNNKLVKVSFTDESGDVTYGEGWYELGTKADQIQVPTPTKDSDDTFDYVFDGWDSDISDVTSNAVYKAHFTKLRKRFGVKYAFSSATPGQQLPDEVLVLLPKDENSYPRGSEITAGAPSQTVVETADGTWTFEGYDRDSVVAAMDDADDEGNVSFSGTWKFTKKSAPVQPGGDTPANPGASSPAAPNAPASAGASFATALPQTSDPFGAGACLALLAAGVAALGAGALAKK